MVEQSGGRRTLTDDMAKSPLAGLNVLVLEDDVLLRKRLAGFLEKEGAVKAWRDLMGATDPAKADDGTIRKEFGSSVGENATHGSDSDENAAIEISYFFSRLEIV